MNEETVINGADIDVSRWPPLDEIIAHLAWEVEQPNSHPLCLYEPLILAIGRRLAKSRRHSGTQDRNPGDRQAMLSLPHYEGVRHE